MKKIPMLAAAAAMLLFDQAIAQLPAADQINTNNGVLTVQPVYHAALVLGWAGKTIYVDPYHGADAYAQLPPPDLVLITDIHQDHLDLATLRALKTTHTVFVVPQAVADQMPAQFQNRIVVLDNGSQATELGIGITAVPMYNLPNDANARHPKGRGNGYILQMGGKQIYVSGDTEDIAEMRALKDIDVAFICMNQPYTMTVAKAANAVLNFKPTVVYPYHYRNKEGFSDVAAFKDLVNAKNQKIEVRLRDWYGQPK